MVGARDGPSDRSTQTQPLAHYLVRVLAEHGRRCDARGLPIDAHRPARHLEWSVHGMDHQIGALRPSHSLITWSVCSPSMGDDVMRVAFPSTRTGQPGILNGRCTGWTIRSEHSDPATRSLPGPCARRAWATM